MIGLAQSTTCHRRESARDMTTAPGTSGTTLETVRLRLEPFALAHAGALSLMDSDPAVMRFIGDGSTKPLVETIAAIKRVQDRWDRLGYSWWTIFERSSGTAIGAACLQHLENMDEKPLEIGWRLRPASQSKGFATEAGRAIIEFGFGKIGANSLLAVTNPENVRSRKVMERLGMTFRGTETHYGQTCVVFVIERDSPT
jgi:RimJ/RimL family protein N-acetyltransferase